MSAKDSVSRASLKLDACLEVQVRDGRGEWIDASSVKYGKDIVCACTYDFIKWTGSLT